LNRSRIRAATLGLLALAACTDTQAPDDTGRTAGPDGSLPVEPALRVAGAAAVEAAEAGFQITLRFNNGGTASQLGAFETARAKWEGAIVGDVPDVDGTIGAKRCGNSFPTPVFNGLIDDILIDVLLQPIDGPGAVLGAAGPCLVRSVDNLSLYGIMFFDTADLGFLEQFGILDEVIVHEMGHVLGIGTLWNFGRNLLQGTAADPRFVGPRAVAAYQSIGGKGISIPVEDGGGPGTRFSHWDEETFGTELMTGFIGTGQSPLSVMTIESLADMGYIVNPQVADRFRVTGPQERAEFNTASTAKVNLIQRMREIRPVGVVE
jgi:hypothetical protein